MGLAKLISIFKKYRNRKILVYFDPDVDGLMSGLLVCRYLDSLGIDYAYYVNSNRAHGFKIPAEAIKGYLVICVDFAITSEEMQNLVNNDVAVISLDHHETENQLIYKTSSTCEGIVLNNQYPFEPDEDRYLSGAGVVFETICKIDETFNTSENRAIVGITLLSDVRPIENEKARRYLAETYSFNPVKGYIGYLLKNSVDKDYGFGQPRMDRNFIDYSFAPRINALLRFGMEKEAMDFILGINPNLPDKRSDQKEVIEEMRQSMRLLELSSVKIVVVRVEDCFLTQNVDVTNFIGLLCSNVKGNGKSVFAFVLDNGTVTRASFRGQYDEINYRDGFQSIGVDAQGHHGAFGVVNFTFNESTWGNMDSVISNLNLDHNSTVKIINANNLSFVLNGKVKNSLNGVTLNSRGFEIANKNCYVRDLYRTYIRYTGNSIVEMKTSPKFTEYLVDGRTVKCFNKELNPRNGLILPILEKGYVQLYLRENIVV